MSKYVIVDLEMCGMPHGIKNCEYKYKNEIIQIGAVMLDENMEISDTFVTYVKPQYGIIDLYIEELTGISAKDVRYAPHAEKALKQFAEWLGDDCILVSWSESDEYQVRKEMEAKSINIPDIEKLLDSWIDCQKTFSEKMHNRKCYKLSEALNISGIDSVIGEHDALIDAHNTALLFAKMEREPELVLSPYFTNSTEDRSSFNNPFAELLKMYSFA